MSGPGRTQRLELGFSLLLASLGCSSHVAAEGWRVPIELADAEALKHLSAWDDLPLLAVRGQYSEQTSRDRGPEDTSSVLTLRGNRDFNNFICSGAGTQMDTFQSFPFRFDEASCPETYVQGAVLGRFEGSGTWVRGWLTSDSLRDGPAGSEVFRVYVDDDPQPRIEVPLANVLDGSAGELFAPPFGAGSTHRMAWYYPLVFNQKLIIALDGLGPLEQYFYQNDVVMDPAPIEHQVSDSVLPERAEAAQALLATAADGGDDSTPDTTAITLPAGGSQTIERSGPATFQTVQLRAGANDLDALADVQLTVHWDDADDAAIDLPLLDLFAASFSPPELASRALASYVDGFEQVWVIQLPMPFRSHAVLEFQNQGSQPVAFTLALQSRPDVPTETFGHLHVQRRETVIPVLELTHQAASVSGAGRLVGVCVHAEGHGDPSWGIFSDPMNFLEGDVNATLDGVPALDGTGTEDYADNAFYFIDSPQASPFAQAWGLGTDLFGITGQVDFCHWHVYGTELSFLNSLDLSLEIGQNNADVLNRMRSVAYLYLPD
jgi:hypothetical protein